jgi:hypothetical protein
MKEYTLTHRDPPLRLPCPEGHYFRLWVDAGVLLTSLDIPKVGSGSLKVSAGSTAIFTTPIWVRGRSDWVRFFVLTIGQSKGSAWWRAVKSRFGRKDLNACQR